MPFLGWVALVGALLLAMALLSPHVRRLPISSSIIYLAVGFGLGPLGMDWVRIDWERGATWLQHLTELAVMVSLFIGGLKLRLPLRHAAWRTVSRLAAPLMLACIAGVAAFAHWVLGLEVADSLLLGAVLAPTDPVLASAVTVSEARDEDRVRYGLSGEAGLNDGMAFPFVVLALSWRAEGSAGPWLGAWAMERLLWAVPAALCIGYVMGRYVSRTAMRHKSQQRNVEATSDFLALSLIALSYVTAEALHAWGFLAVFGAGVGFRHAEVGIVAESPHPDAERSSRPSRENHPPAEDMVPPRVEEDAMEQPAIAAGVMISESLTFGATAERFLELLLVTLVGASLATHWDLRALPVAFALFVVLRPLGARLLLAGTPTTAAQRWLLGWFGVRGIGSLYYLAYAAGHHGQGTAFRAVVNITLSVVALSILVHGATATPLLTRYERSLRKAAPEQGSPVAVRKS